MFVLFAIILSLSSSLALDNGLARTPPMGWMSWERFRCNIDCKNDPDHCISENLYMEIADRMVADGYKDAGYEYVSVDDCWLAPKRDAQGKLQADPIRFPHGMKYLADYIHSKGLKFGLYEDYGNFTCAGYPGSIYHLEQDANTFAEWGVDYLKFDGCYADPKIMDKGYPEFGKYLNKTGRPIVYSCSWPAYQVATGIKPNYTEIAKHCNLWRNFDDIGDSLSSVLSIIDYYIKNQDDLIPAAGPGNWNDPDELIIGNFGLSYEQSKAQMAVWAVMASPLIMSVDLRTIKDEFKYVLQNKDVIAINQDSLGIQGKHILKTKNIDVWVRPITPKIDKYFSYAICFLSRRDDGMPYSFSFTFKDYGLINPTGYHVVDVYDGTDYGTVLPDHIFTVKVNPSGVVLIRAQLNYKNDYPQVFLI